MDLKGCTLQPTMQHSSAALCGMYSLAVPVVPTSIYEHTLVARPNFRERCGALRGSCRGRVQASIFAPGEQAIAQNVLFVCSL